jgi:serine/threonine protein kinase
MRDGRWVTVTESEFAHERQGLETIREKLLDAEPWRAWSNFTFTAHSGHPREVDLLVVAPRGVFLIELKDWHGSVEVRNGTWLQTQPGGKQLTHSNPLHLANRKAKELAGLLARANGDVRVPWVSEAVCFTDRSLKLRLPPGDLNGVFYVDELIEHLKQRPRDEGSRIDATRSRELKTLLERIGIARSDAEFRVGPYRLDRSAFDTGPSWADYLAHHTELPEAARIRVYLRERGSDAGLRSSVERAARREATVLRNFRHPGVVQLKQYDPSGHLAGPALIFEYDPRTLRLEEYLAQFGDRLDILARLALVRQLAETVRSAHRRKIFHRTLSARAIHVIPRGRGPEDGWLSPILQLSDWQVAVKRPSTHSGEGARQAPTKVSDGILHIAEAADPYLAPELTARNADPVYLDVYGLGVLTYLLVTGKAPAASQAELVAQLEAGEGLRPSAVVDGLSSDIDELVQAATAYLPTKRLASVDDFLEMLEVAEDTLTAPIEPEPEPVKDPLEAVAGDLLADRWEVIRRLGTGSTSRAFLVRDLRVAPGGKSLAVLKIALSDARAAVLRREAEVLRGVRGHSSIIRPLEPEPVEISGRTILVTEYVGDERTAESTDPTVRRREETVARQLREQGRLLVDQLEAYGDHLFDAVEHLESEGVWHRDIKPDNIAIRIRPNRTRQLVLIDFSLAGYPVKDVEAGTEGYLDPFIVTLTRSVYDAHAERYALAVTLHEMASRELPTWGDGTVHPRQTDQAHATIAVEAFDPAVRDSLAAFFAKALHRDIAHRFSDLKPMKDAWKRIFLEMDQARPSRRTKDPVIADAEPETADQERDRLALAAGRDTPIEVSGLSPAAVSLVHGLEITTVGKLLDFSQRRLVNAPGLGAKTRTEIQQRIKQWNQRLEPPPPAPLTPEGRKAARNELSAAEADWAEQITEAGFEVPPEHRLRNLSLDALATIFVPDLRKDGSNRSTVDMLRLLLRIPDESGALPPTPVWPNQREVSEELGRSRGRIPQILKDQRTRWKRHPAVRALRAELIGELAALGRVASAAELAVRLAKHRGTVLNDDTQRLALAMAAVRVVVEVEQLDPETRAYTHAVIRQPNEPELGGALLALEVGENDSPDTPSAPALLDYGQRLGKIADRLADMETMPTPTTVLAELSAISPPEGFVNWDERRMVELAAAASHHAAATPRLEIYPRKLPLVRALRLTQAGLARLIPGIPEDRQPGLTQQEVHERVRARFPELFVGTSGQALPTGGPLTSALKEAGFDLKLSLRSGAKIERYLPRQVDGASSYVATMLSDRRTRRPAPTRYADDTEVAAAVLAQERLIGAVERDGFRVLTVRTSRLRAATAALTRGGGQFAAKSVSAAHLFIHALHELVDPRPKPTWETILKADVAAPGSNAQQKFDEYARTAWGVVEPRIGDLLVTDSPEPLLLLDGAVFARYAVMGLLERLAERARQGGRPLWLLCPQADPAQGPRFGEVAVPLQAGLGEWIVLPDAWVTGAHLGDGDIRSGLEEAL